MNRMNKPIPGVREIDRVEVLGRTRVQHGKASNRIYLMKLDSADYPDILGRMDALAEKEGYTKIIAKVPEPYCAGFAASGYKPEARVPLFFNGREDAFFMAKFLSGGRAVPAWEDKIKQVIERADETSPLGAPAELDTCLTCRILTPDDADALAALYREVFESYPFPIRDPGFLREAMADETVYFGIFQKDRIVAASSCEMDTAAQNVEMTDFATLPSHRARGFAAHLLFTMDREMKKRGIQTAYTIARAVSYGMNITFARQDYVLAGTLVNNTDIAGSLESMNVWYKNLAGK